MASSCVICKYQAETIGHVLTSCAATAEIWQVLQDWLTVTWTPNPSDWTERHRWVNNLHFTRAGKKLAGYSIAIAAYLIWKIINHARKEEHYTPMAACKELKHMLLQYPTHGKG